jgi:hypothetical protein
MDGRRDVADILTAAGLRISKTGAWTRNTYARDARDTAVNPNSTRSRCWCAIGAIFAELGEKPTAEGKHESKLLGYCLTSLQSAASREFHRTTEGVNDSMSHEDVLTMYRSAIRMARITDWGSHERALQHARGRK